jgi:hypothetical protein
MSRARVIVAFALAIGCRPAAAPPGPTMAEPTAATEPTDASTATPTAAEPEPTPSPAPTVPPGPVGCWAQTFGAAPEGSGHTFSAPVDACEACDTLRAGPNAVGLHPEVLRRLVQIQDARPAPPVDEPVLWVNSGPRDGKASKSMHNQALAVDVVVCGLDSPGVATLLREAGFTCVIEYYDPDGKPCKMAHGDLRDTPHAKAAYAPGAWKSGSCPARAVSRGADCQNDKKSEWSYAPSSAG